MVKEQGAAPVFPLGVFHWEFSYWGVSYWEVIVCAPSLLGRAGEGG